MIKEFALNNGKNFVIRCVTGTVIDNKTWSETEIKSSQNPGYVTKSGVMIGGGTKVSSSTIEKQDVWLRTDDGKEECFRLNHNVLQTRQGHRLSIAVGGVRGKEPNALLGIYKFNDGKTIDFTQTNRGTGILFASGLSNPWIQALRWAFYCGCVATVIGVVLIPIGAFLVYSSRKKSLKELSTHLNAVFNEAIKRENPSSLHAA